MSGSLNIYPFHDTETAIRFGVQVCIFIIGLIIANRMIIKPALRLQEERKKRTSGNQILAQGKLKHANELENTYDTRLNAALDKARTASLDQIRATKENASTILHNAQQKSNDYLNEIKEALKKEKQEASANIHLHTSDIVKDLYAKLGVKS